MRGSSGHTTEDAYPKMFPVNSIHASAPRCTHELVKEGLSEGWECLRGWAEKSRSGRWVQLSWTPTSFFCCWEVGRHVIDTHDNSPTPNPETNLPTTILGMPPVKVWIAPPMVKTTAPVNRVPLRPIASPMRPAASEVTVEHQCGMRGLRRASEFSNVLNAPISSTETIMPNSPAVGSPKYSLK